MLKEAGLQLLQVLAAPVQLQQLSSWQAPSLMISQLYALRGAADIVIAAEDGTIGELFCPGVATLASGCFLGFNCVALYATAALGRRAQVAG